MPAPADRVVPRFTDQSPTEPARFIGGPMDGEIHPVDVDTDTVMVEEPFPWGVWDPPGPVLPPPALAYRRLNSPISAMFDSLPIYTAPCVEAAHNETRIPIPNRIIEEAPAGALEELLARGRQLGRDRLDEQQQLYPPLGRTIGWETTEADWVYANDRTILTLHYLWFTYSEPATTHWQEDPIEVTWTVSPGEVTARGAELPHGPRHATLVSPEEAASWANASTGIRVPDAALAQEAMDQYRRGISPFGDAATQERASRAARQAFRQAEREHQTRLGRTDQLLSDIDASLAEGGRYSQRSYFDRDAEPDDGDPWPFKSF